ncbi:MAG: hypothetical protein ACT4P6_10895 [Gemmatimonadaceae bacterium]
MFRARENRSAIKPGRFRFGDRGTWESMLVSSARWPLRSVEAGTWAGISTRTGMLALPFVQRVGAQRRYLPPLPGDSGAKATGINDAGLIAGFSRSSSTVLAVPVFWDSEGRVSPIPGIPNGETFEVSETGWIVGWAYFFHQGLFGFRWRPGGPLTLLGGDLGSQPAQAFAVNDAGVAVGIAPGGSGFVPALWNEQGVVQRLPLPAGARGGRASDINNAGDVVGDIDMAGGMRREFKWTRREGLTLLQNPTGTTSSYATDIDSQGRVFGYAGATQRASQAAYVWVNGSPMLLPQLYPNGIFLDVNACGIAVGGAQAPDMRTHVIVWRTEC